MGQVLHGGATTTAAIRRVELILACGIVVSYESIREWGLRFGRLFANAPKRKALPTATLRRLTQAV